MTTTPMPRNPEVRLRSARAAWVKENHGILARIARRLNTRNQWVSQVLYGAQSSDGKIESALAEAGAPGMKDRVKARRIA